MAEFKQAHDLTARNEGAYANNPADAGGQTYKGIARKFWGSWRGWVFIDRATSQAVNQPKYGTAEYKNWVKFINGQLAGISALQELVLTFYRVNFWDKYRLSEVQSQQVANWLYDHAVNGGGRGAMWMQEAAGVTADGDIGPKSIEAINAAIPADLLSKAREIAKNYRLAKVEKYPDQKQFLHSWLSRDGYSEEEIKQIAKGVTV